MIKNFIKNFCREYFLPSINLTFDNQNDIQKSPFCCLEVNLFFKNKLIVQSSKNIFLFIYIKTQVVEKSMWDMPSEYATLVFSLKEI